MPWHPLTRLRSGARRAIDSPMTPTAVLRWSVVSPIVDRLAPKSVLEVGCGQGSFGARIALRSQYVGLEPDPGSFAVAESRISAAGGHVVNGAWQDLDGGHEFDLVCAFEVLEHLDDDRSALMDWRRLVRSGGWVLLSVPCWPERFGPMDRHVGHYRRYTPDGLAEVLVATGFTPVDGVLYGWPLAYALEAVRNRIALRRATAVDESMADRSAKSGRLLQPTRLAGPAVRLGAAPFALAQRLHPNRGTGLIALARRTEATPAPAGAARSCRLSARS